MRTFLTYMMTLPGKKLMFMGGEFAQFREWDYKNSLEWFMTGYPRHAQMQHFVKTLNHLYRDHPQLWEIDDGWDGFRWIDPDNADEGILSYRRIDSAGHELVIVLNFVPVCRENLTVSVPKSGTYNEILNTDAEEFGGDNRLNGARKASTVIREDGSRTHTISITLPPHGAVIFEKKRSSAK